MLTPEQQTTLLILARRSIESCLGGEPSKQVVVEDPNLSGRRGAFVTLTRMGKLRGCIGYSEPLYPLHEAVARCAVSAATQDCRFSEITRDELSELEISISVLSPLEKLDDLDNLEPGRHGLMIVGKDNRGLLLPQVAAERGWDGETFLTETCRKAALPADAWKGQDVEIFVFEAEVFSEKEPGPLGS